MSNKPTYEELEKEIIELRRKNEKCGRERGELQSLMNGLSRAKIGINIVGIDYRIISQNQILEDRFGSCTEQLCYEKYMGLEEPCDFCPMMKAIRNNRIESVELTGKDGRTYEVLSTPLPNPDGIVEKAIEIGRDITEKKQIVSALLESKKIYKTLFDTCGDGILIAEIKSKKFIEANSAICKMLGYSKEELLTKSVMDIHPKDSIEFVIQEFNAQANGEKLIAQNISCLTKQGSIFFADISTVKNTIIEKKCNIGFFRDITIMRKLEEKLQHSQKMESISTLAGGIAHDFNNMLSVISGNISYAVSNLNEDDELYKILADVLLSSKQAENLTQQLLTFSKGNAPIKKVSDINKLLKDSVSFSTRGAAANCCFELSDDLWKAEVDGGQINQVISNIVINANQAMLNGGTITIKTENAKIDTECNLPLPVGRYVKILVEDQGVGISKKHLSNIFDPFFTTKQKGNGLGLAITYSIIQKHGGHIDASSEVDKGTVFNIYLPASLKTVRSTDGKKESKHTGQGNILVMDDQEPILKMVGRMLNNMGYDTTLAIDGHQAIELYREAYQNQKSFDLVLLDLTVPGGMGGAKTFIELLKIDPNAKAVVSSGYSNDSIMANYEDYGFCGVVPKPCTMDQLAEVLNKIFS